MKKRGQTLLEIIIATSVVAIALVPLLLLVTSLLIAQAESKERVQATFLAQEAIEYIHNARDSAINKNLPWFEYFTFKDAQGNVRSGWYRLGLDVKNPVVEYRTYYSETNGVPNYYPDNHDFGPSGNYKFDGMEFKRYIAIKKIPDSNMIEVIVTVTWPHQFVWDYEEGTAVSPKVKGRVVLREYLTEWKR